MRAYGWQARQDMPFGGIWFFAAFGCIIARLYGRKIYAQ